MARDLKEAIENFKSAARPFQAIVEILEQLDASATDLRTAKDLEQRAYKLKDEQETARAVLKEEKAKAKAYADQKIDEADKRAEEIVAEARRNAEAVLNSAQVKASAVENAVIEKQTAVDEYAAKTAADVELAKELLSHLDKQADEAEKRLAKAQASIAKLLEG